MASPAFLDRIPPNGSGTPDFNPILDDDAIRNLCTHRLAFHFHVLALDGVLDEGISGDIRFHEATGLSPDHAHRVARTVQRRVLRAFRRRELRDDATADDMLPFRRPPLRLAAPGVDGRSYQ